MSGDVFFDPYDRETIRDPHALFRRMRDETPLYYSDEYDFYALSRFDDIEHCLLNKGTFLSRKGVTLDLLKSKAEIPPGTVIFEDDPAHAIHRALISRMFTPKRVSSMEGDIRDLCVRLLDPFVGSGGFDYAADFGSHIPTAVIGMLLGIPTSDQEAVRDHFRASLGEGEITLSGEMFADYIDWRVEHPSDDIMSQLLHTEFEDETGSTRRLTRNELLAYVNIIAAAGNETTQLLIGWTCKLLAEHPDQRQLLVDDPSLVTGAIDEVLRYEPNTLQNCRYVGRDVELHGKVVPAGSIMMTLTPAGNRDERQFAEPDRFDIRRKSERILTFGFGAHYCLGQALARLEGRVALEEVLKRFPTWDVDLDAATFIYFSEMRGFESLPVVIP